jgi:hypothetical protein
VPHCRAGYGVGEGAAQRAEAAKGNEYFICRLLVLTIDGKQGYPAAQLAAAAPPSPALPAFSRPAVCYTLRKKMKMNN